MGGTVTPHTRKQETTESVRPGTWPSRMGLTVKMKPVDRSGKTGDINRPLCFTLVNTRARALGINLPPWRNALERYLQEKYRLRT